MHIYLKLLIIFYLSNKLHINDNKIYFLLTATLCTNACETNNNVRRSSYLSNYG